MRALITSRLRRKERVARKQAFPALRLDERAESRALGLPLPFKGVGNRRSIISVETLANVVTDYALDKVKWQGIELITDPQPLSTESIVLKLNKNEPIVLFSVPKKVMKFIFILAKKKMLYEKLFEDLVFESSQSVLEFVEKELK